MTGAWGLPMQAELGGVRYAIRSDYRDVLELLRWLNGQADPALDQSERWYVAMRLFYPEFAALPQPLWPDATQFLTEFLAAGRREQPRPGPALMDWQQGEALFTHFGLSGPLVLSASTYIEDITKHRYICEFDLKPALDEKTLYDRLTRDFAEQGSHSAQGALAKLLPNSMRPVAVEKWGIDPATKAAQITREQKQALVDLCKHWQVPVSALGDKEHAVITAGGVDVREVDPKTMASKLCAGLYFAGEVLDVDARTGGYNLQIAWSTAVAAARAL